MTNTEVDDGQIKAAFEELGALENEFADVELDARKPYLLPCSHGLCLSV
jgi:hypothetical protein